jgi:pyridoxal 5'-phosphate synthase pdxT subunit
MGSIMATDHFTIGILALQGDFEAHRKTMSDRLGIRTQMVRSADEMEQVDGLILPGGESTTIGKLMERHGVDTAVQKRVAEGMPVYGTCAGLILMAKTIDGSDQHRLGLMDVTVTRNAFGRQLDSFEADIPVPQIGDEPVRGVFIRAPYVSEAGPEVEVLGEYDGRVVAVRQGHLLGSAFHPELTDDPRMHEYFARMVKGAKQGGS